MRKRILGKVRRMVVKVGSALLLSKTEGIDPVRLHAITKQIAFLMKQGVQVVLVTSGAIACGRKLLKFHSRPLSLPEAQAAAAVGQSKLMKFYDDDLRQKGYLTSQILLTQDDFLDRKRYWNARNTILSLLRLGALPIVNENDTIATEEICFGDNDRLSSMVACLMSADLLVLLSDIEGLYEDFETEERRVIERVAKVDAAIEDLIQDEKKGKLSRGGMKSKLQAAKTASAAGIPTIIANGYTEDALLSIVAGEPVGTLFLPKAARLGSRKSWIAFTSKSKGKVVVDEGAKNALLHQGRSLLSSGIIGCREDFSAGEVISIVDEKENEFARGLVNYSSDEVEKIKRLKSSQIASALGYKRYDEVIHRDNMVVLEK
ncbi:MAG: glutamate 5-kinase [Candidatus Omnitrophota bacterium]